MMMEQGLLTILINAGAIVISGLILYSKINREVGELKTMITQHIEFHKNYFK